MSEVVAVPAATVVLLRDRDGGMEALMLRKSSAVAFAGMRVFPGGRIDAATATRPSPATSSGPLAGRPRALGPGGGRPGRRPGRPQALLALAAAARRRPALLHLLLPGPGHRHVGGTGRRRGDPRPRLVPAGGGAGPPGQRCHRVGPADMGDAVAAVFSRRRRERTRPGPHIGPRALHHPDRGQRRGLGRLEPGRHRVRGPRPGATGPRRRLWMLPASWCFEETAAAD